MSASPVVAAVARTPGAASSMPRAWRLPILTAVWLVSLGAGFAALGAYAATPGPQGVAPPTWPEESALRRDSAGPTLLLFLHPQCSCSRASLSELDVALTNAPQRPMTHIVLVLPTGLGSSLVSDELRERAAQVSGTEPWLDVGGAEAARFGAMTSGHLVLYDASGRRAFAGGITLARGHAGDNVGRRALERLLADLPALAGHAVFGCPLEDEEER